MKTLKLYFLCSFSIVLLWSCEDDELLVHPHNNNSISLEQLLRTYELWYVDLNSTSGNGQTAFIEMAFTFSFLNGDLYANNNLVGFGEQGNGYGIPVGEYNTNGIFLDIYHDIDGFQRFEVYQESANSIELYNSSSNTSYFLDGYQRNEFDYDEVFFENIDYFLQEYETWEKTFTSLDGSQTNFDNENYISFYSENSNKLFKSSEDINIGNVDNIYWDYSGAYNVNTVSNSGNTKILALDYDFFDNDLLELSVINDELIRLYHSNSGKTYEFRGINNIVFMRTQEGKKAEVNTTKVRPQKTKRKENMRVQNRSSSTTYFSN
jgi:hypothetical protein